MLPLPVAAVGPLVELQVTFRDRVALLFNSSLKILHSAVMSGGVIAWGVRILSDTRRGVHDNNGSADVKGELAL